jgi:hypothetical protein
MTHQDWRNVAAALGFSSAPPAQEQVAPPYNSPAAEHPYSSTGSYNPTDSL